MNKYILLSTLILGAGTSTMAKTPEQILADGQDSAIHKGGEKVRKGEIKALIENVKELNVQLRQEGESKKIEAVIKDIRESIPRHNAIDVFEAFPAEDWFQFEDRPGMIMVGVFYLQHYPDQITGALKTKLSKIAKTAHPLLKQEIEKLI